MVDKTHDSRVTHYSNTALGVFLVPTVHYGYCIGVSFYFEGSLCVGGMIRYECVCSFLDMYKLLKE